MVAFPLSDSGRRQPGDPLVGREREQDILRRQWQAAMARQGGLAFISGEAGIGKTALAAWLAAEARELGGAVRGGQCFDLTQTPPYGPWRDAFAAIPESRASDHLARLLSGADLGAIPDQTALFARVRNALAREAGERPLLVVLEDLHWSDPASLALLRHVAHGLASLPILLIATYRADELGPGQPLFALLPLLARETSATRIELGPLPSAAIQTLVERRYRLTTEDATRLVNYLHARAGGNPFFVVETLRALESDRLLVPAGERWLLGELAGAPLPPLVRQTVEARLATLDAETLRLLEIAAVIGQEAPLDIWQSASGAARDRLAEAKERALEARLALETPVSGDLVFTHALVRETLYHRQPLRQRQTTHRRVAELLAERREAAPSAVAAHFVHADDPRAVDWLLRSGERALALYAAQDAYAALARAQEIATRFSRSLPPAAYRAGDGRRPAR